MKEIYRIKFDKHTLYPDDERQHPCQVYTMYTLGCTGEVDGELLTPQKITLTKGKIRVDFKELGIRHIFTYTPDVELFYREKDADKTTDNAQ